MVGKVECGEGWKMTEMGKRGKRKGGGARERKKEVASGPQP